MVPVIPLSERLARSVITTIPAFVASRRPAESGRPHELTLCESGRQVLLACLWGMVSETRPG